MSTLVEMEHGCYCWDLDAEPAPAARAFWDRFLDGLVSRDTLAYRLAFWEVREFIRDRVLAIPSNVPSPEPVAGTRDYEVAIAPWLDHLED